MTLRLVLVSLVAALGLTVPGAARLESWVASTQNWMNARFADWDTRHPQDADYVIVSNTRDIGRLAATVPTAPAPIAMPAPASDRLAPREASQRIASRPVTDRSAATAEAFHVVFRPASFVRKSAQVPPTAVVRLARWELDRDHDGRSELLGVKPPVVRRPETPRARVDFLAVGKSFRDRVRVAVLDSIARNRAVKASSKPPRIERRPIDGLMVYETLFGGPPRLGAATKTAAAPSPKTAPALPAVAAKVAASNSGFGAMEKGGSLYFAGRLEPIVRKAQPAPLKETVQLAAIPPKPPTPAAPKAEAVKPEPPKKVAADPMRSLDDADLEMDGLVTSFEDGFGTFAVRTPAVVSRDDSPKPDPVKPAAVKPAPVANLGQVTPPPSTEVTRAVRLTREAVYAWVNVFTGPAVVTVTQPRDTATR